jgi:anhydro-N-acetylmuramic acid kinase
MLASLRPQLADLGSLVVRDLIGGLGVAPTDVTIAGTCDPGLWSHVSDAPRGCLELGDAARLAELTGLNVVDAFAASDMARGGQGGPLAPLAEWVLLKSAAENRLLVDLGRSTRMTYLPEGPQPSSASRLISFDVGPGMALLDCLTRRLTNGSRRFDSGGRMAVQGRRIPELVAHWLKDDYFQRPLPRWHPRGVCPERFLDDAVRMALEHGWSIRDLLCSATHFIVDAVAMAVDRHLPENAPIGEILLVGGGLQNGMLLREIGSRLPGKRIRRVSERGLSADTLGPACVALLALFFLDRVPANLPPVTGAEVSRVLGRLTPGSPHNWQRLIDRLTGSRAAIRPLSSAL